eukprot:s65_g9.t1
MQRVQNPSGSQAQVAQVRPGYVMMRSGVLTPVGSGYFPAPAVPASPMPVTPVRGPGTPVGTPLIQARPLILGLDPQYLTFKLFGMRSTAGTPPGSGLVARQGSVVALPGSFVAAPVVRVAAAPQTPRVQQAPQAYRVVRSQSLVQPQPSQALTKLVDLLENEILQLLKNNIEKVMLAHYRKYASDRGMMRPEGARSFLMSLAMSLGFSNPQQDG